ncbi:MAG: DoxX family protein [Granulosicoccaceae bacterium]
MKIFYYIVLVILIFLAVSSGISKIMLMEQDVEFFGQYGFTSSILIVFGAVHIIGGILLALPKTRIVGAVVVGISFLISAVVLILAGNIPVAVVTFLALLLLVFVAKKPPNVNTTNTK